MAPALRAFIVSTCMALIAAAAMAGTITGTVTSAETKQPLRSMVVAAYDVAGSLRGTATTDATGLYILILPAGRYRVVAWDQAGTYAPAFDGGAESFETSPLVDLGATDTRTIHFALLTAGSVTGFVLSPTGASVANATVAAYNLSGTRRGFTTTNAQGSYSLVLPPGEYKLVGFDQAGAYAASFYREAKNFLGATPVRVTARAATQGIDFRLGIAARVLGNVFDASVFVPVAGIDVYAYTESGFGVSTVSSDANGVYRLAVPEGRYRFVAADPLGNYGPSYYNEKRSFATADVVELIAGQTAGVQFLLRRAAVLGGRVTDANGVALASITVAAYNADGTLHTSATTGTDGRWELALAPGAFKLVAFDLALSYVTEFYPQRRAFAVADVVSVASGERITNFDFSLDRGARVSGVVTDSVTNQLLAGIHVAAYDGAGFVVGEAITRAHGPYAMVVPPGAVRLLAFDDQLRYATAYDGRSRAYETTTPRQVTVGATETVDFALVRGVKVTGTVTDRTGASLSGIDIVALDMAGNHVAAAVASSGAFAVVVLPETYRFVAHDPAGRYIDASAMLVVGEGQSPVMTFVLNAATRRRAARH